MRVELQRTQRVSDTFDRIALTVRPVIRRVHAPTVAGAVVRLITNPVHDGIAQLHVLVLHVNSGTQHACTLVEVARPHPCEQRKVLVDRPIPERAFDSWFAVSAALFGDCVAVLVVDVCQAIRNEELSPLCELRKVIASK